MRLTQKRWLILVASCLINLCLGSIYAWSVFASAMAAHLSAKNGIELTTGDLAIVYTVANSVGPVTMICGGWFNDRFGPKKVILTGGIMFGAGMILSGGAGSVGALILSYGLLSGLGLGMAYGTTISSSVKFFPDKRGLVGGITTAVYGFSSVILPPVVTAIVGRLDVTFAFRAVGVVFLIVIAVCSFFMDTCPKDFVPDGWTPPAKADGTAESTANFPADCRANCRAFCREKDWRGMLKTPEFYVMIILLTCGAFCGMMIIPHTSAIAENMVGMSAMMASTAVSVLALFNAAGRIAAGTLSDKIGRINTLMAACVLSVAGMLCLYFTGAGMKLLFFAGIAVTGICFGAFMGVFPGFTADQFGAENNSVNYGIMFIGFALAGFFGPSAMKNVYTADGVYQRAFLIAAALGLMGVALTFVFRFMVKRTHSSGND